MKFLLIDIAGSFLSFFFFLVLEITLKAAVCPHFSSPPVCFAVSNPLPPLYVTTLAWLSLPLSFLQLIVWSVRSCKPSPGVLELKWVCFSCGQDRLFMEFSALIGQSGQGYSIAGHWMVSVLRRTHPFILQRQCPVGNVQHPPDYITHSVWQERLRSHFAVFQPKITSSNPRSDFPLLPLLSERGGQVRLTPVDTI